MWSFLIVKLLPFHSHHIQIKCLVRQIYKIPKLCLIGLLRPFNFAIQMRSSWFDWSDRKSTRLNSSHANISYAVFCLKKKKNSHPKTSRTTMHTTITLSSLLFYFSLHIISTQNSYFSTTAILYFSSGTRVFGHLPCCP